MPGDGRHWEDEEVPIPRLGLRIFSGASMEILREIKGIHVFSVSRFVLVEVFKVLDLCL